MTIAEQLRQEGRKEGELKGKLEGKLEGRLEGKLEGKMEVARSLLKMSMPRETIMQATGLTEEELNRIQPA